MAIEPLMGWDSKHWRWKKMHRGKMYTISCRQLRQSATKMGSVVAANEWWRNKLAELNGLGSSEEARRNRLKNMLEQVLNMKIKTDEDMEYAKSWWSNKDAKIDGNYVMAFYGQDRASLSRRIEGEKEEDTLGYWQGEWNKLQDTKMNAGGAPGRYKTNKIYLRHFINFAGADKNVKIVNSKLVQEYYQYVVARKGWKGDTKRKIWIYFKSFAKYLYENEKIERVRNLKNPDFTFEQEDNEIDVWTAQECAQIVRAASGQPRLHILLCLNCGMTMKDISDLKPNEVDWHKGIISRKRSKMKKNKKALVVPYKLWDETFSLLKEHRGQGERVLTKVDGSTWHKNGSSDVRHLEAVFKFAGLKGSHIKLRRSASTLIGHKFGHDITEYFDAHVPDTITRKHYLQPDYNQLAIALDWLKVQILG
jgi:integrase